MYLSDTEMEAAIADGSLVVEPTTAVGPTSIDLHLDSIDQVRIWDWGKYARNAKDHGNPPLEVRAAQWNYGRMAREYLMAPPREKEMAVGEKVFRRDEEIVLMPSGFVLWQTKERIGTPQENPRYICFIDGKSTRARTGLVVHLTAPTIHAGWSGNVTLEITNLGPFHLVLKENDVIAQITVAQLTSSPRGDTAAATSSTHGQTSVAGAPPTPKNA